MGVHEVPAAATGRPATGRRRLVEIAELARAEQAMADGCPTPDQELLLIAAGSMAHRARRHPSLGRRPRAGRLRRWLLG
ncbi:hypothetical protein BCF44_113139 [Kutzneria buriramensis]|uniref:Uncharacterized protein n=2 Tax=Kutzneria buriramensis TaxID=1045776 RepID=A0A3E0H832_9PSEU|nr:hypothetical protein BCF44_113139 [Kutzneria buriramensis]